MGLIPVKDSDCFCKRNEYSIFTICNCFAGDGQLQGLLGNLDQQQLLQLLSGYGGLGGHGGLSSAGSSISAPAAGSPT